MSDSTPERDSLAASSLPDPKKRVSTDSSESNGTASPMARIAAISSLAVMGSRLLGLVREQAFAYFFGASREYDAFLTAFRIPNLLRDLLAEGALSAAFVTVFSKELAAHGKKRAFDVANSVTNALALLLALVVVVGMIFAPSLVGAMAIGFDADKAALTVVLTRAMFPYIFFAAMSACCMGMLNAQGKFGLPQSASTFFNITSIVVGLASATALSFDYMASLWLHTSLAALPPGSPLWARPAVRAMLGMSVGTLLGGLVQWLIQVPTLRRLGWRWRPGINRHDPALHTVLRLMGPAVLGAGAVQLSVFVNSNFASSLGDRQISWLAYSFRLMQFPIGVFGVAIMAATLPTLAKQAATKNLVAFGATLTEGLELGLCLTIPAALGLAVLSEPILRLIFQHGRFTAFDTQACAAALCAYSVGLPAYSALKVLQPAFVARDDARTPMVVSLAGVAVTIFLNVIFLKVLMLGHVGLALSTSCMAIGSTTTLVFIMERRSPTLHLSRLFSQGAKITVASAFMGLCLAGGYGFLQHLGLNSSSFDAGVELLVLMPFAAGVYVFSGRFLGIATLQRAIGLFKRKLPKAWMGRK